MRKYLTLNRQDRIGHLYHDVYNYYANYDKSLCLIVLYPAQVANQQLYKMWLRKFDAENICYIELNNKISIFLFRVVRKIAKILDFTLDDDFKELNAKKYYDNFKTGKYIFGSTTFDCFENKLYSKYDLSLNFTNDEERIGKNLLSEYGLVENKFVIFHSRDGEYLNENSLAYHEYRNVDFKSFTKAISWLDKNNIKSLRFGVSERKVDSKELSKIKNYIDYAKDFRTDFLDIYLISKAKYFIGNTSGPYSSASFFNKSCVITNQIPIDILLTKENDIFIWKKLVYKSSGQLLSLEHILKNKIFYRDTKEYLSANIEIVNNSEDEILEACKEMETQLNGFNIYNNTEDIELLEDFMNLMTKYLPDVLVLGKPSLSFLKSYPLKEVANSVSN